MHINFLPTLWPKLRSFFEVFLLLTGRCYEAEICAILLLLRCSFIWYPFWPKSNFSDSGRKPWTIIRRFGRRSFFVVFLLLTGRCLRHSAPLEMWYPFWPKSKLSISGRKPWTIVRHFDRNVGHSLWSSMEQRRTGPARQRRSVVHATHLPPPEPRRVCPVD